MIIRCPQCASTYEIAATTQVVGKKVRCSHCTHVWRVEAVEEDAPSPPAAEEAEAPADPPGSPDGASGAEEERSAEMLGGESVEAEAAAAQSSAEAPEPPQPVLAAAPSSPSFDGAPVRPARQREDRYSLDPFDGGLSAAPRTDALPMREASVFAPAAERRLERERGHANGYGHSQGAPAGPDPARPAARRKEDASWGPPPDPRETYGGYESPGEARRGTDPGLDPPAPRGRGNLVVVLGWLALIAALGAISLFAVLDREAVVRVLPGAAPLYASAGLAVNLRGLEFRDVSYVWTVDGKGRPAIDVGGEIENVSGEPQMVPTVVFAFQDEEGLELFHWATPVRRSPLPPGKRSKFQARIPAPPEAVRNLQLRFARAYR